MKILVMSNQANWKNEFEFCEQENIPICSKFAIFLKVSST